MVGRDDVQISRFGGVGFVNNYGDTGWYPAKPEERYVGGEEAPASYAVYEKSKAKVREDAQRGWLSFAELPDVRGALSFPAQGGELSL